jgi:pilus assembly protein Flp/PilA
LAQSKAHSRPYSFEILSGINSGTGRLPIVNPWRNTIRSGNDAGRGGGGAMTRYFSYFWEHVMKTIVNAVKRFSSDEGGVTAIEYGLIASVIGVAALTTMQLVGTNLIAKFSTVATAL